MKLMMNGAVTIGTLDGANVEMYQRLGDDNMFLFGLHADQVESLRRSGYDPKAVSDANPVIHNIMTRLSRGFADGKNYSDLVSQLLFGGDQYMVLADFADYLDCHRRLFETIKNPAELERMSMVNIAESGVFAADRAVGEYADGIWRIAR
jgi:starch phosphorylase